MNGGYFVLRKEIFRYIKPGEELVYEPFQRLISEGRLWSQRYDGFWQCMDTFRDKQILDELEASGAAPWRLWKNGQSWQPRRQLHAEAGSCQQKGHGSASLCFAWVRIPTTSRLVVAGRCCSSKRLCRDCGFTGWFSARRESAARKPQELQSCLPPVARRRSFSRTSAMDFCRIAGRGEGFFRGDEKRSESGSDLHALAAAMRTRTTACLGTHLEHVSRPSDPGIRDSEIRW